MRSSYLDLLAKYGIDSAHPGGLPLTKKLLDNLQINSNTKLIDLGCGTGRTLAYIAANYPCKSYGIDISDKMLKMATHRFMNSFHRVQLVQADITELPFAANMFDVALSESVTIFTEVNKALDEYARILKPGGILIAIEMTAKKPFSMIEMSEIKSVYGIDRVPTFNEWETMFKDAGFRIINAADVKITTTLRLTSIKMIYDFYPHFSVLNRYKSKLGYMIYLCQL